MSKVRPVVVADKGTYFYLTFKMTSHAPRPDFEGEYSVQYWKKAGLKKPTTIRASKVFKLRESRLLDRIGRLDKRDATNLYLIALKLARKHHDW